MAADLTAVIVPEGQLEPAQVRELVRDSGRGAVLVRVAPLPAVKLMQIEVHDARTGLPTEDPALVARLSRGGRATFLHVNHQAQQAMVHGFTDGKDNEGFAGAPDEAFASRLRAELGLELPALLAADDGTRLGIGVAASHTTALLGKDELAVPVGTPTGLDSFFFHDRGVALAEGQERLAWLAFDRQRAFGQPGRVMAERLRAAPEGALGPLEGAREQAIAELLALGERSPEEARLTSPRALELCACVSSASWAGGDEVRYWDERVLPLFALCGDAIKRPPVLDATEAEELDEEAESLLAAMAETLPVAAPPDGEGPLLASLSTKEVGPLAPWLEGDEQAGAMFTCAPERLLSLVRGIDGRRLGETVEAFARGFYRALRPGQPEGDLYATWRQAKEEAGKSDLERFVNDWAELRACLELAAANRLSLALLFYQ